MARIRTVKPEFFTSEDIVALSPFARLLYIALWCEADKEGRMVWKPNTFKMRYLPGDSLDIHALCQELVDGGLVVLYGDGLAAIPKFRDHQHINPRESESKLAAPPTDRVHEEVSQGAGEDEELTRAPRVTHASVTRREEGKGREGVSEAKASSVASDSLPTRTAVRQVACSPPRVVDVFHEVLPELPACRVMTPDRERAIRKRWQWVATTKRSDGTARASNAAEVVDWFRQFFELARDNDFLMGRVPRGAGHEGWKPDLDYLLSDKGLRQVVEKTEVAA